MKKYFYILTMFLSLSLVSLAQDDDGNGEKIRERMREYVQKRLGLSKAESERFGPVFLSYFNDLRKTNQQYKSDRLVLQQKIVDLRIQYREQFKPIIGDRRSNDVFLYERDFIDEVKRLRQERSDKKGLLPNKRIGGQLQ